MAKAGRPLDPWQQFSVDSVLGLRADEKFAARTGVIVLPRQNGKGVVDEAVELAEIQLLDFPVVLHTAHHAKTAKNAFDKMRALIEGCDWLRRRLASDRSGGIRTANGEWGFTFKSGQRLIYGTRTSGAGRGLTIDALTLDEAQELSDDELEALIPTTAAAPNPLVLWSGSAPKPHQEVFRRMIVEGRSGTAGVCYLEWSAPEDADLDDPSHLAVANPGLGYRLDLERIRDERSMLSDEGFGRERLGIIIVDRLGAVFPPGAWESLTDSQGGIDDSPTFAIEVSEDRGWACIGAAGDGPHGLHVELGDNRRDTDWVISRAVELDRKNGGAPFVVQKSSPAGALIPDLKDAGLRVVEMSHGDYVQACGMFYDRVVNRALRHSSQAAVDTAVRGVEKKPSGDAWVFNRRGQIDVTPFTALSNAAWAHVVHGGPSVYEDREMVML